jgi:hypothetical protein
MMNPNQDDESQRGIAILPSLRATAPDECHPPRASAGDLLFSTRHPIKPQDQIPTR